MKPLISVIMPVHNAERFLKEAIDSILNQTFSNFELIIINDGSSDTTESIILSFSDSRIRYIKNLSNLGIVKTLNNAIDIAEGIFIARMDADDISHPNRLDLQYQFMQQHPEIAMCGSHAIQIDQNGTETGMVQCLIDSEDLRISHLFNNAFIHPSTIFRSDILKSYRYNEEFENAEDYYLFSQIMSKHKVQNINKALLFYRVHQTSITHVNTEKMAQSRKKVHFYQLHNLLKQTPDAELLNILESISTQTYFNHSIEVYDAFFFQILAANRLYKTYPIKAFERRIKEKCFQILMVKADSKIFHNYFISKVFSLRSLTLRQLRKMIKLFLKS
ncbi:MAG: glycosyltransferase [Pyrinomonadaceae bacterium]|nr:glycosyltransferase [Sphingobacteriaceae bacterium]